MVKLKIKKNNMQKILIIICNIVLLAVYMKSMKVGHPDGWIYLIYIIFYDFFFIAALFIISFLNKTNPLTLVLINLILQNWVVFTLTPPDTPFYGILVDILLIFISILSMFYQKLGNFLDKY